MMTIGDRMKTFYENRSKTFLSRRTPVIIRIDGKSFHTFTKGFEKPFDLVLRDSMNEMIKSMCKSMMGVKVAYTQSDEVSFLLTDFDKLDTEAWFDYNIQKVCSVSASMATLHFNKAFQNLVKGLDDSHPLKSKYESKIFTALFDSRCFNIPEQEVTNYFIWRQQDATRNAIQSLGYKYFSYQTLIGKNCSEIQEMLFQTHNVNFNDYPVPFKRGFCVHKEYYNLDDGTLRSRWKEDFNIPIFTQEKDYIEKFLIVNTEG